MRLVHSNTEVGDEPKKRVPLYKDKAAIRRLVRQITLENNARVLAKRAANQ